MSPQSSKFTRRGNEENTPPKASKLRTRGGIHDASRRRRARIASGLNHPRYAVEHAKHKSAVKSYSSQINIELPRASRDAQVPDTISDDVSMSSITFPRYLSRPVFSEISKEIIMAIAPELADTELLYIRDGLQCLGPVMLQVLAGVKAEPTSNVLPKELDVTIKDLSSDMPTHMLAVYSHDVPATTKRRVTLFPIHNIILATHCANLPLLPPSNVARPDVPGSTVSVPVVPLCIPAPDVFPQLSTFLYTKRVDHLLASLLPCPAPAPLYRDDPTSKRVLETLQQYASKLATSHSVPTLLTHAIAVNGLWRNVCALGIDDEKLWCALDVAWEVLIIALAISTGSKL